MKNITNSLKTTLKTFFAASVVASMVTSYGDDTEVFYTENVSKPNLLFVLDNSGSMNLDVAGNDRRLYNRAGWDIGPNPAFTLPTRLTVLQQAVQSVLLNAPDNVNIGLMRFGPGANGGNNVPSNDETYTVNQNLRTHGVNGITFPSTDINANARTVIPTRAIANNLPLPRVNERVRTYLSRIVNSWTASGGTPLVDALYEAALYYRGESMRYGLDSPTGTTGVGAHPTTYSGSVITNNISTAARNYANAPSYISPITSSCQSNYIVLMSDGNPTYYYQGAANTQNLAWGTHQGPFANIMQGNTGFSNLARSISSCAANPSTFNAGTCGPELTRFIADNDNIAGLSGNQRIKTFSIGFGRGLSANAQAYLRSLETIDDDPSTTVVEDGYFSATDPASLAAAFRAILSAVAEPRGTLASPGYSVNVKNGLEHENDIYVPVFDRKNTSRWSGNLKKFKLVNVSERRHIRGKNNLDATNELGVFSSDAIDYWSRSSNTNPDGTDVRKGGLANRLNPAVRNIYSNLTGDTNVNLSNGTANEISINNISNLTNSVLGLNSSSSSSDRTEIINFMRGWKDGDTTKGARYHMGDMLHSEPLVMTYAKGNASGVGKRQYIFAGTNEGYLHAFSTADSSDGVTSDSDAGKEMFAFIPKELLSTISVPQFLNAGTQVDHRYGVDGALTGWHDDTNSNGEVDSGEQVILYFGLRRGGSSFYALDVSNINEPKLLWTKSATDYPSMGQSWSIPYLAKVGMGANRTPREVVIISGGYDEDEDRDLSNSQEVDDAQASVTANVGNDILILDARTGVKLWSLSSAQRRHITSSIPGGIRILDTNYNGLIDRMYFADTGGNVWRLDLSEKIGDSSAPASDLTKFAELGGSGVDARKFYNEPDVAKMKLRGKTVFVVSIGSGFRAHPMDETIDDKFFILVDSSPYRRLRKTGPEDERFQTITTAPMDDEDLATITVTSSGLSQNDSIKDTDKRGWKINFAESGEKVLGTSIAIDGNIAFTSLVPEVLRSNGTNGIDECAAPITQSRFYVINVLTGGTGMDLDGSGSVTNSIGDVFTTVSTEILGKPQVVFNPLTVTNEVNEQGTPTGERSCKHPVDIRTGKKLSQASGYDACRLESVYWTDPVSR